MPKKTDRRKPSARKLADSKHKSQRPTKATSRAKRRNPKARSRTTRRSVSKKKQRKRADSSPPLLRRSPAKASGRPTLYTPEIGERICALIMAGQSLRHILANNPGMPESRNTVFLWIAAHKDFADAYRAAKEIQMLAFAEEIIDIADDSTNDWIERETESGELKTVLNAEALARSRMRIETRKWEMSKFAAKQFGEKLDVTHAGQLRVPMTLAEFEKRVEAAEA